MKYRTRIYYTDSRDLPSWENALGAARLPVFRGMRMDEDDDIRAALIQSLMRQGEVHVRAFQERHGIGFAEYFADDLQRLWPLADDGLVDVGPESIRATPRGHLLLRNIAMCFDRYLDQSVIDARPRFSRAI